MRRLIGSTMILVLVAQSCWAWQQAGAGPQSDRRAAGRKALEAGDARLAEREWSAAIEALKANPAADTPLRLAPLYLDLCEALSRQGRAKEALPLAEWALTVLEAQRADDPEALARALSTLGRVHVELGDFAKAVTRFDQALPLIDQKPGPRSPRWVEARLDLGRVLIVTRDEARARATLSQVLDLPNDVLPETDRSRAMANLGLAVLDEVQGNHSLAVEHLKKAEAVYAKLNPPDPEGRAKVVARLEEVQRRLNQSRLMMGLKVDFGTPTSPVEPSFVQVTSATEFSPERGYGWMNGKIGAIDRATKSAPALTRDINYTSDGTFGVKLPVGTYDVSLLLGDLGNRTPHDRMGIFLQDQQVAVVDVRMGEMVTKTFPDVAVGSDQMLKIGLRDLGGADAYVTIASLIITPKTTGMRVVRIDEVDPNATTIEYLVINFSHPLKPDGLTKADVLKLQGPTGPLKVERVSQIAPTRWAIGFAKQSALGTYTVSLSPRISDADGIKMDQNGNGKPGEDPDDGFTGDVVLSAVPSSFDFGTARSPLAASYTRVSAETAYSPVLGYGWISGSISETDRGESAGTDLTRDLNATADGVFAVDLPVGAYDVTLTVLDTVAHDQVGVILQGVQVDTLNSQAGQVLTRNYPLRNTTRQVLLQLKDLGGADPVAVINGLSIRPAAAKTNKYYVATNGNDRNDGSLAHPWKTLQAAVKAARPGDAIYLREGKHIGGVVVQKPNITIRGYPGEHAELSVPSDVEKDGTVLWFTAPGAHLEDLDMSGGFYYVLKFDQGNALVQNCKLHHSGRDCVKITPGADDVTIRKCEIYSSGLRESNADGIDNVNGDRMLVQDCYIHDIVGYGVFGKGGATATVIERNLIKNAAAGVYVGGISGAEFFDAAANPNMYENIDGIVRNNTIVNVRYAGIGIQGALRPQVYNNTVIDSATVGQGAIYIVGAIHYPNHNDPKYRVNTPTRDVTIYNTIVTQTQPNERPMVYLTDRCFEGFFKLDHNRYDNAGKPALFWDMRKEPAFIGPLAKWQPYFKADEHTTEGPPGLDPATHHLLKTSPCIAAGLVIPAVFDDIDLDPRTDRNDIGSDQFTDPRPTGDRGVSTHPFQGDLVWSRSLWYSWVCVATAPTDTGLVSWMRSSIAFSHKHRSP